MNILKVITLFCALGSGVSATAQGVGMDGLNLKTARLLTPIVRVANKHFSGMPQVQLTSQLSQLCGGDERTSMLLRYCTDINTIYVAADLVDHVSGEAEAAYLLAHAYGHALQVRFGIADIALAKITADRSRELELRSMVTRQVECFAGVLHGRGLPKAQGNLVQWFAQEPFTDAHWGSDPMRANAQVSIGLSTRNTWFTTGRRSRDFASCAVEEIGAELILRREH